MKWGRQGQLIDCIVSVVKSNPLKATIRQNLLWAKPDATDAELKVALCSAVSEFMFDFPNGLKTVVGNQVIVSVQPSINPF